MKQEIKVWDLLVRVFHWSLVVFFTFSYLTGEEESELHIYSGYVVLGLISFRVLWGLIGTRHARFSDFLFSPREVIEYTKGFIKGRPKHYLGHNPLGALMVFALLFSLFITTLSGLKLYAVEEGEGPFAQQNRIELISNAYADSDDDHDRNEHSDDNDSEEFWEEIHEAFSEFTVFLVFLHIGGVLASSLLHDENLVRAMVTGKKKKQ